MMEDNSRNNKWTTIVTIVLFFAIGIIVSMNSQIQKLKDNNSVLSHSMIAMNDTILQLRSKNGDYISSIKSYECDLNELKLYAQDLSQKLEDYKKLTKTKPVVVSDIQSTITLPSNDTVFIIKSRYFTSPFDFSDKFRKLTGNVTVHDTLTSIHLDPEEIILDLTVGTDENKKTFVMTDNPYVRIHSLKGYIQKQPKTKHWGIGITGGYGLGLKSFQLEPYIGIGISYNIIQF